MAQVQYIKHMYENEEQSLRAISRTTGISQATVRKYAHMENWNAEKEPVIHPERYKVLGDYLTIIDGWLTQDAKEPRKQRHTVKRIYDRLKKEHNYTGGYSSVKKYVRKKKFLMRSSGGGFLPLLHPACNGETDFGKFKYYDGLGRTGEGYALSVSFPCSNAGFTQVFPSENQECLLEGLKRIFYHIGGVPIRIKADNMTTAVAHICAGTERELTDGFTRFMLHHRFQADFCNPASGNEKGNVENKVGYTRRNFFVPVPVIEDFDSYNEALLQQCDEDMNRKHYIQTDKTIAELWTEEKKQLLSLPKVAYEVFRYETLSIDKYGFVTVDTAKYGISPEYAKQKATVKIFASQVEIYHDHALLKTYERSYKRNDEVMDFTQYLTTLQRKPGAVPHTRFFDQMPKLWQQHLQDTQGKERKTALLLLSEIVREGNLSLSDEAVSMAYECGRIDTDSIRQCYLLISKAERHPAPLKQSDLSLTTLPALPSLATHPNLFAYDDLMGDGLLGDYNGLIGHGLIANGLPEAGVLYV